MILFPLAIDIPRLDDRAWRMFPTSLFSKTRLQEISVNKAFNKRCFIKYFTIAFRELNIINGIH